MVFSVISVFQVLGFFMEDLMDFTLLFGNRYMYIVIIRLLAFIFFVNLR